MSSEEIEKLINALPPKQEGLREIKIIESEFIIQGVGILMLHPKDYEEYVLSLNKMIT